MKEPELVVLIANSNYRHSLGEGVDREYEKRRQTCEAVAKKLGKDLLRDLTLEELEGRSVYTVIGTGKVAVYMQCN